MNKKVNKGKIKTIIAQAMMAQTGIVITLLFLYPWR